MVMREKALRGDVRALDALIELARQYNSAPEIPIDQPLDAEDRATLDAYAAELAATVTFEPTQAPTNTGAPPTRPPHSGKKEQQ